MKTKRLVWMPLFMLSTLLASCGGNEIQNHLTGETIVFPPQLKEIHSADSLRQDQITIPAAELASDKHLKLVIVTDGNCGACFMELLEWQKYLQQYQKEYESVYATAIMSAENVFLMEHYIEQIPVSLPLYLDTDHLFVESNALDHTVPYTFLLNANNEVLYNGSPLKDKIAHRAVIKKIKRSRTANK